MRARGLAATVALAATLLLPTGTAGAHAPGSTSPRPVDRPTPRLLAIDALGSTRAPTSARLLGADGQLYDPAPTVVEGASGRLYYGPDLDIACSDGTRFRAGLRRLARLARVIERSGRRVVLTVPPSKPSVYPDDPLLPELPHGQCTASGLARQNRALDRFAKPLYLPLRPDLAHDSRQVYYRTDSHWNTVGASVYSSLLANRLDPALKERQQYRTGEESHQGDLFSMIGIPEAEVAPALWSATDVRVRASPTDPDLQHSWRTGPRSQVLDGRTLLVGDSFTWIGMDTLRPLFRKGRFVWVAPKNPASIVHGVVVSDTVVLEVLQRFVSTSIIGTPEFRKRVRVALATDPR